MSNAAYDLWVSEPTLTVHAEDQPSWAEVVRRAEHGESASVIAHGVHVADVVPSGELDRLRETIDVLSDSDLVQDLREGLADARAGHVFSAEELAADLAARRAVGESALAHLHDPVGLDADRGRHGLRQRIRPAPDRAAGQVPSRHRH